MLQNIRATTVTTTRSAPELAFFASFANSSRPLRLRAFDRTEHAKKCRRSQRIQEANRKQHHPCLPHFSVQNSAGHFVTADSNSMTAAAEAMLSDSRNSITNPSGHRSYPISSFTWILVPENINSMKREAMREFLRWMLSEGQTAANAAGFARLPPATVQLELRTVEKIP
jgi:hypothetical protein